MLDQGTVVSKTACPANWKDVGSNPSNPACSIALQGPTVVEAQGPTVVEAQGPSEQEVTTGQ